MPAHGPAAQGSVRADDALVLLPYEDRPEGPVHVDNRSYNETITALRARPNAPAPCSVAGALDRVTVCPQRIGAIVGASLVLNRIDRGTR